VRTIHPGQNQHIHAGSPGLQQRAGTGLQGRASRIDIIHQHDPRTAHPGLLPRPHGEGTPNITSALSGIEPALGGGCAYAAKQIDAQFFRTVSLTGQSLRQQG